MDTSVDEALSRVEAAAFALIASDPAIRSVGVGYVDEGVGFVAVRSMEGASAFAGRVRRPGVNAFEGVPIRYQSSLEDPRSLARIPIPGPLTARLGNLIDEQQLMRPLACGVQIQNFDDDVRQGVLARGFMSVGSLGCFVRLADGAVALLTNNHVVAGENRGVQGVYRF